jgi:aspartate aminotransferase-like enzyme
MKDKEFLMIPGPTPTPESVLLALAKHPIGHRTPEFSTIFAEVQEGLKWIFQTKQDVITFASSGSGAMEAAIYNTINTGEKVLCVVSGKFGERWRDISKMKGALVDTIDVEWGQSLEIEVLRAKLAEDTDKKYKTVCVTHNETSTGVTNPLKEIADVVKEHGALLIVDTVTSLGAINMPFDDWGIDIAVSGSQKGFMIPPGLGFIALSDKAWKAVDQCSLPSYYFNLKSARKNLLKNTTPYTPAVNMFVALNVALKMMQEEGLENIFKRHARLASSVRAAASAMGLKLYVDCPAARSNSITAIEAPEGMNADDFRKAMKKRFDISLAGGQEHLKGKIFRIGHLGFCADRDILATVSCMEVCLAELGHSIELGKGSAAAAKTMLEFDK